MRMPAPLLLFLFFCGQVHAAVTVTVKDSPVRAGEPFELVITATGDALADPDLTALKQDFDVIETASTSVAIVERGYLVHRRTWIVSLVARRPGRLPVPSFHVGAETSRAMTLRVARPSQSELMPPAYVEVHFDRDTAYVHQQVLMTVRLFILPEVTFESLSVPTGENYLVEPLSETVLPGNSLHRGYELLERRYALFPSRAGQLEIEGPTFKGQRKATNFAGFVAEVTSAAPFGNLKVIAPPIDAPRPWLPVSQVHVSDTVRPAEGAGGLEGALIRTVEISASGGLPSLLPELGTVSRPGLRVISQDTEVALERSSEGVIGKRSTVSTLLPEKAVVLPEMRVHYWNVERGRAEVAAIAEREIRAPALAASGRTAATSLDEADREWGTWMPTAAVAVGCLSFLLVALKLRSSKPTARKRLSNALRTRDPRLVRAALIEWARERYSDPKLCSLCAVAGHTTSRGLLTELERLDQAAYGPWKAWDPAGLVAELRKTHRWRWRSPTAEPLQLYPSRATPVAQQGGRSSER